MPELHMPGKSDVILCSLENSRELCSLVLIKIKAYPQFQPENKNTGKHTRAYIMHAGEKNQPSQWPIKKEKQNQESICILFFPIL